MEKFGIGQPVSRKEDPRLVTGRGRYTDDINLENQVRMYVVRATHAHAELGAIGTDAARAAPGVLAVLTGDELVSDGLGNLPCIYRVDNIDGSQNAYPPRPLLARGRVRYVGEPVAIVIAETLEAARDAADLVEIDYTPLACITDTARATDQGVPVIWDDAPNNVCYDFGAGDKAVTDAVFETAVHVVSARSRQQPGRPELHGAARRACRIRRHQPAPHAAHLDPILPPLSRNPCRRYLQDTARQYPGYHTRRRRWVLAARSTSIPSTPW